MSVHLLLWNLFVSCMLELQLAKELNQTILTPTISYTDDVSTTSFHTSNNDEYSFYISYRLIIVFECSANQQEHNTALFACPNVSAIKQSMTAFHHTLASTLVLNNELYIAQNATSYQLQLDNNYTLLIHTTLYLNDQNDYLHLLQYINSSECGEAAQDVLDDIDDGMLIVTVDSELLDSGMHEHDDDNSVDEEEWYKRWLDVENYGLFQYIVVSCALFFIMLCICVCSFLCCCRNRDEHDRTFMKNPNRYDSEWPGYDLNVNVPSFSTRSPPHYSRVNYVE
eukprot:CAMPEP_0202694632 /NCGR_PEP_ID=MMETSP1385-20130828/8442_1 /ASSEMBLY_ACC=CAM_ASM_000861 /TAXON_ID=933848 /ORGANISM="Elphidium margaritaceum" /LENGTH=281 /DNA_ID=CAMNT_0049350513 /DNA_START=43 /DNA_END=888 /DNA_ORIENTATION=-